mgnify:CR=1 FL=1
MSSAYEFEGDMLLADLSAVDYLFCGCYFKDQECARFPCSEEGIPLVHAGDPDPKKCPEGLEYDIFRELCGEEAEAAEAATKAVPEPPPEPVFQKGRGRGGTARTRPIKPVPCKKGDWCTRLDCIFVHPWDTCRFGDRCRRSGCVFTHA